MQIWQLFIFLRHPVTTLVTVFNNLTELTFDLFISLSENLTDYFIKIGNDESNNSQTNFVKTVKNILFD